jgi:tetratricopeptide (TPR) repeat protein
VAYAARGAYKAQQGFFARGDASAGDTPQSNIDEMQRLHHEAAKDLQIAIAANPHLTPAYTFLLRMAKTSSMPFTAKEMLDQAEKTDKRSFYVRHEYIVSLQPRWGGSHEEMSAYAKSALKYADLNPRIWSLQGAADADRGEEQYRAGDYVAAVKLYTKALRFGDSLAWLKDRAACYCYQDKSAEAIADYRRVLSYDPNDRIAQIGVRGGRP